MVSGQSAEATLIDSLLKVLANMPDDTNKVKALSTLSRNYYLVQVSEGFRRGNEALALAEKLGWKKGIAMAYSAIGSNYWSSYEYVKAGEYFLRSLKIEEELGSKPDIARDLHAIGTIYGSQKDKSKAIEYLEKSLTLFMSTGNFLSAYGCNLNIGDLYGDQNNLKKAWEYYKNALEISRANHFKREYALALNVFSRTFTSQHDYAHAVVYADSSIKVFEQLGRNFDLARQYAYTAEMLWCFDYYSKALIYFQKAIKTYLPEKNKIYVETYGSWYASIGKIQIILYKKDRRTDNASSLIVLNKAISNFERGLSICKAASSWRYSEDINEQLSEAYSMQGKYKEALHHLKMSSIYKDSIAGSEKSGEMTKLELEYLYNKKKDSINYTDSLHAAKMNDAINHEKLDKLAIMQKWLYSVIAFVLLALVLSYFLFRYRTKHLSLANELLKEQTEKKLQEADLNKRINDLSFSVLRSQMNPHFIFNVLNTIQSFVMLKDKKTVSDYLGKFSEMMRKFLETNNQRLITLQEEIDILRLYLDLEKARFGESLLISQEVDPELEISEIQVPPFIIQPYAENAIKHGLFHKEGEKRLDIRINKSTPTNEIEIVIDDNGIGREKSEDINKSRESHFSFANDANNKRIELINNLYNKKATIRIKDKTNPDSSPSGTTVIINLPYML